MDANRVKPQREIIETMLRVGGLDKGRYGSNLALIRIMIHRKADGKRSGRVYETDGDI